MAALLLLQPLLFLFVAPINVQTSSDSCNTNLNLDLAFDTSTLKCEPIWNSFILRKISGLDEVAGSILHRACVIPNALASSLHGSCCPSCGKNRTVSWPLLKSTIVTTPGTPCCIFVNGGGFCRYCVYWAGQLTDFFVVSYCDADGGAIEYFHPNLKFQDLLQPSRSPRWHIQSSFSRIAEFLDLPVHPVVGTRTYQAGLGSATLGMQETELSGKAYAYS